MLKKYLAAHRYKDDSSGKFGPGLEAAAEDIAKYNACS